MLRDVLVLSVLVAKLINCSKLVCEEDAVGNPSANGNPHCNIVRNMFRFSMGPDMFYSADGIPYQYHIPRVNLNLADLNNGYVKMPGRKYYKREGKQPSAPIEDEPPMSNEPIGNETDCRSARRYRWRLADTTRELSDLELKNLKLWQRDTVPLNRLTMFLESPVFLGKFFYALTSLTEVNGTVILSRFYYAPVFTAKYGNNKDDSKDPAVSGMDLNVFSVCIEPSDAPEDASIPLIRRPQRIIDAGLRRSSHNATYDVREKLRGSATDELAKAEKHFASENWHELFLDMNMMASRRLSRKNSSYSTIKTPFGDYFKDYLVGRGPRQTAFYRYDSHNSAYIFVCGPGHETGFDYSKRDSGMLIFLDPKTHFENENKLWDMCVDLWKEEMLARYGAEAHSCLINPHAYLDESASTAPYYEMLPRYEAMRKPGKTQPLEGPRQPKKPSRPRMTGQKGCPKKPRELIVKKMQGEPEMPRAPSEPEAITGPEEPRDSGLLSKRYLPVEAEPVPSGLANFRHYDAENWTGALHRFNFELGGGSLYPESNVGYNDCANMPQASGTSTNEPYDSGYWTHTLPSSAGFSNIGTYPNGPSSVSTGYDWESNWSPDADFYNVTTGQHGAFYSAADTTMVVTLSSMLPVVPTYDALSAELTYDNLPFEAGFNFGEIDPDLLTEFPQIDDEAWATLRNDI